MKDARLCPRLRPLSPKLDCRSLEVNSALQTLQLRNIKSRKAGSRNKNIMSPKNTEKNSTKISGGLAKGLLSPNVQRTTIAHFSSFKHPKAKRIIVNCDFAKSGSKIQKAMKRRQIADVQSNNRDSNNRQKRKLSVHVCSRWYRAPEICLLEKSYG